MKTVLKMFILISVSIFFSSCKKEIVAPSKCSNKKECLNLDDDSLYFLANGTWTRHSTYRSIGTCSILSYHEAQNDMKKYQKVITDM